MIKLACDHTLRCSEESRQLKYFRMDEMKDLDIVATHKHIIEDYKKSLLGK